MGGALLTAVALLLALLAMRELVVACRSAGLPLLVELSYPLLVFVFFVFMRAGGLWSHKETVVTRFALLGPALALCIVPLLLMAWAVVRYATRPVTLVGVSMTGLAIFYTALFAFLPLLAQLPQRRGTWMIWLLLLGVWSGDTAAYYAGRAFGRCKLTPLSPGKTLEGVLAGALATVIVCTAVAAVAGGVLWYGAVLGVLIAVAAPLGDLAESFWKRELGVKDLGTLLPGHGGVLDRCDSLLFAAPVVYLFEVWRQQGV
jgi:phosphatidate cytidylyltransferase